MSDDAPGTDNDLTPEETRLYDGFLSYMYPSLEADRAAGRATEDFALCPEAAALDPRIRKLTMLYSSVSTEFLPNFRYFAKCAPPPDVLFRYFVFEACLLVHVSRAYDSAGGKQPVLLTLMDMYSKLSDAGYARHLPLDEKDIQAFETAKALVGITRLSSAGARSANADMSGEGRWQYS